jgi:toxin ParE1/3/4
MAAERQRVRLTREAERDLRAIILWTTKRFGTRQAAVYGELIDHAVRAIGKAPLMALSKAREEVGPGIRTLHIGSFSGRGCHILLYRISGEAIVVGRILHDGMELKNHLPGWSGKADPGTAT